MTNSSAWEVLMLFLIPIGGGIPGGVLLAKNRGIGWPEMCALYFLSDVILAFIFESIMIFMMKAGKKSAFVIRLNEAFQKSLQKMTSKYGVKMSPLSLIALSFGVDPMTGRVATLKAGHGFFAGWALSITGDMFFFALLMVSTLMLNNILGDGTAAALIVMTGMIVIPGLFRRIKLWRASRSSLARTTD